MFQANEHTKLNGFPKSLDQGHWISIRWEMLTIIMRIAEVNGYAWIPCVQTACIGSTRQIVGNIALKKSQGARR